jgi:hypothetical protein
MAVVIDIPKAIISTLSLIIFMLAVAGLFWVCLWVIFKVGTILYKWLSKRKFVLLLRQKYQKWWNKNKVLVISLWEFVSEVVIDPVFYGYVLFTLVQRLQSIADYSKTYPQYKFMQLLNLDMNTDTKYYIVLLIIFSLWMFWRAWKHRQEKRFQKNINDKLDKLVNMMEKKDGEPKSEHFDSVL